MSKETEGRLKEFLLKKVRPILKQTAGKEVDLSKVVVWLEKYNSQNSAVTLGIALQGATGCSPFCGCAAKQLSQLIERMIKREFHFIMVVTGQATMPPPAVLAEWQQEI